MEEMESTAPSKGAHISIPSSCPVCMRKLKKCELGKPETCGHYFCFTCIYEWSKNVNTCPVDRLQFNLIEVYDSQTTEFIRKVSVPDHSLDEVLVDPYGLTYCEVCSECTREDRLLLCDGCDKGYHLECLEPPLDDVPEGNWYCSQCEPIVRGTCELLNDAALTADSSGDDSEDDAPSSVSQVGNAKVQPGTTTRASAEADVDSKAGIIAGLVNGSSKGKRRSKRHDQVPVITSPGGSASSEQDCSIVDQHQSCLTPGNEEVVLVSGHEGHSGPKRPKYSEASPFLDHTSDNGDQCISLRRGGFLVDRTKARPRRMRKRLSLLQKSRDSRPLLRSRSRARTAATGSSPYASIRQAVIAAHKCASSRDGLLAAQQIAQGVWQSPDHTVQYCREHYGCPALYPMVQNLSLPRVGYSPGSCSDSLSFKSSAQVQELSSHSAGSSSAVRALPPASHADRCAQAAPFRHKATTSKSSQANIHSPLPLTPQSGPIRHTVSQTQHVNGTPRVKSSPSISRVFKPQKLDFSRSATTDYVGKICQNLDDLQAKEHIFHRDGSIEPVQPRPLQPSVDSRAPQADVSLPSSLWNSGRTEAIHSDAGEKAQNNCSAADLEYAKLYEASKPQLDDWQRPIHRSQSREDDYGEEYQQWASHSPHHIPQRRSSLRSHSDRYSWCADSPPPYPLPLFPLSSSEERPPLSKLQCFSPSSVASEVSIDDSHLPPPQPLFRDTAHRSAASELSIDGSHPPPPQPLFGDIALRSASELSISDSHPPPPQPFFRATAHHSSGVPEPSLLSPQARFGCSSRHSHSICDPYWESCAADQARLPYQHRSSTFYHANDHYSPSETSIPSPQSSDQPTFLPYLHFSYNSAVVSGASTPPGITIPYPNRFVTASHSSLVIHCGGAAERVPLLKCDGNTVLSSPTESLASCGHSQSSVPHCHSSNKPVAAVLPVERSGDTPTMPVLPCQNSMAESDQEITEADEEALLDGQNASEYVLQLLKLYWQKGDISTKHMDKIRVKALRKIERTKVLVKKARVKRLVDDYITIYKTCEPL